MKKIVYVDMDNVLVDFSTGIAKLSQEELTMCKGRYDFRGEKFPDWKSVMEYLI
jgi:hypothetical protein